MRCSCRRTWIVPASKSMYSQARAKRLATAQTVEDEHDERRDREGRAWKQ